MNKSKFLKKSLAAVLAMLMIVAMIPLSAAAATATVSRVSIGSVDKLLAAGDRTVEFTDIAKPVANDTRVKVTLVNDTGKISSVDRPDMTGVNAAEAVLGATGVWQFALTQAEIDKGEATFDLLDADDRTTRETYTIKFTVKKDSVDVSLKDVLVDTQPYSQYGETAVDGDTYTITLPYGTSGTVTLKVYPNNADAVVTSSNGTVGAKVDGYYPVTSTAIASGKSETKVTVTNANGASSHTYTVKTVNASAFSAFSVEGERKAAKIDTENKTVTVYMPYNTKATSTGVYNVTPTFTKGYENVTLTVRDNKNDPTTTAFESGKEINVNKYFNGKATADDTSVSANDSNKIAASTALSGDKTMTVTVKYSESVSEVWIIKFNGPVKNPDPKLDSLTLGTYSATITESADKKTGTAVLNVPASLRVDTSANLMALASDGATVHLTDIKNTVVAHTISSQTAVVLNSTDGTAGNRENFPISTKNNFIIRVTAAGDENGEDVKDKAVRDYYLTINTVDVVGKAEITEMKLEKDDTDKTQYTATIANNVITFKLPFETTTDPDNATTGKGVVGWKLYYALSNGTTIESGGITKPTGFTLDGTEDYLPDTFNTYGDTTPNYGDDAIVVTNGESKTTYKIVIELEKPRKDATLTGVKVTNAKNSGDTKFDYDEMEDGENAFSATGSRDLVVEIPYSKYSGFSGADDKSVLSGTLAGGAKVYYVDKADDNKLQSLDVLTSTNKTTADLTKGLPNPINTANNGAYKYDGTKDNDGKVQTLTIVVVNEEGATTATGTDRITAGTHTLDNVQAGTYTTYTLVVKKAAPQKLHVLDSISVYDTVTKTKVDGDIQVNDHKITFTLPASYRTPPLDDAITRNLYLDISTKHQETVKAIDAADPPVVTELTKMTLKDDGTVKTGTGKAITQATETLGGGSPAVPGISISASSYPALNKIRVESEEYTYANALTGDGGYQEYDVVVKYADVEKGDTLTSVTINGVTGTPDSKKKVSITLPKGSEVTGLKPTFNVSKGAYITSDGNPAAGGNSNVIFSGDLMNLTLPRTLWVMSENGANKTKYTLEVKVDDGFRDVKTSDWFYSYVMEAAKNGIIIGNGDGTFGPYSNVTRLQFATMMARVDKFNASEWSNKSSKFSDMGNISGEAAAAVAYCADKGYITGDGGSTTFRPNATITRQEMAIIICRVLDLDTTNVNTSTRFADDAKINSWAKDYVYACVNANIILGRTGNVFDPLGKTNRAEAATVAIRVDKKK